MRDRGSFGGTPYGRILKRNILPYDIPLVYKSFDQILGIENLKGIVFHNLKNYYLIKLIAFDQLIRSMNEKG